eukprot:TRINITY_DN1587_c0_g1_i1.p1 TRINITY_DN1587_c0_g1~~TRINITY_DN1587_c0_g1_i1.p1  ORF type:complete len:225 (+),score=28.00 TRINITY_DN1587_c0_g1_i1:153-827(+)
MRLHTDVETDKKMNETCDALWPGSFSADVNSFMHPDAYRIPSDMQYDGKLVPCCPRCAGASVLRSMALDGHTRMCVENNGTLPTYMDDFSGCLYGMASIICLRDTEWVALPIRSVWSSRMGDCDTYALGSTNEGYCHCDRNVCAAGEDCEETFASHSCVQCQEQTEEHQRVCLLSLRTFKGHETLATAGTSILFGFTIVGAFLVRRRRRSDLQNRIPQTTGTIV